MNIETVDNDKLKISLTYDEIIALFGSYDNINYQDLNSKATLNILYRKASGYTGFSLDSNRLLIEVKPLTYGCEILFTKIKPKHKAEESKPYILTFEKSEDLIRYSKNTESIKSDLYSYKKLLILKVYTVNFDVLKAREFCKSVTDDEITAEYISEHGRLICKDNAILKFKEL